MSRYNCFQCHDAIVSILTIQLFFSISRSFGHLSVLLHRVLVGRLVVKVTEDPFTGGVKKICHCHCHYLPQLGWVQIALAPHWPDALWPSIFSRRTARLASLFLNCFPHLEQAMKWFWAKRQHIFGRHKSVGFIL